MPEVVLNERVWAQNFGALFYQTGIPYGRFNWMEPLGSPVTVTYRFAESYPTYSGFLSDPETQFAPLPEQYREVITQVFSEISSFTQLTFVEDLTSAQGDVNIMIIGANGFYATGYSPLNGEVPQAGDLMMPAVDDGVGYDPQGDGSQFGYRDLLLHELGHALGLAHPIDYGFGSPSHDSDYSIIMDPRLVSSTYTVMAYAGPVGSDFEQAVTYMPLDILALQHLYGVNDTASAGDDTYVLEWNQGGIRTLWDYGGFDTVDLSQMQASGSHIDLRIGGLSSFGIREYDYMGSPTININNMIIGPDTVIERAIGSKFDDVIIGNDASNELLGGDGDDQLFGYGGDDILNGGAGTDRAIFEGRFDDAVLTWDGDALVVRSEAGGVDRLSDIEILEFDDRTMRVQEISAASRENYRFIAIGAFSGAIGGSGLVLGNVDPQSIRVVDQIGTINFDASFNRGGDRIHLSGDADQWTARLDGSRIFISDGDTGLNLPVGPQGIDLIFADGARTLRIDPAAGKVLLGSQIIDSVATVIASSGRVIADDDDGAVDDGSGRMILLPSAFVTLAGNVEVIGTSASETITLSSGSGKVQFDASFARGGDTLIFAEASTQFQAVLSGSRVVLSGGGSEYSIPVGAVGLSLDFAGDSQTLKVDVERGIVLLGDKQVTSTGLVQAPGQPQFALDELLAASSFERDVLPGWSSDIA